MSSPAVTVLEALEAQLYARKGGDAQSSYTASLYAKGVDGIAKKIGEESAEVIIAGKNGAADEIAWEVGDLLYHTLVLLEASGVPLEAIYAELIKRRK